MCTEPRPGGPTLGACCALGVSSAPRHRRENRGTEWLRDLSSATQLGHSSLDLSPGCLVPESRRQFPPWAWGGARRPGERTVLDGGYTWQVPVTGKEKPCVDLAQSVRLRAQHVQRPQGRGGRGPRVPAGAVPRAGGGWHRVTGRVTWGRWLSVGMARLEFILSAVRCIDSQ